MVEESVFSFLLIMSSTCLVTLFGYINSTPFDHKSFKSCSSKLRAEEVSVIGMKDIHSFRSLSDVVELYFI